MLNFGLAVLFFLPVIESISREAGFIFLLAGSLFLIVDVFRGKKIRFDAIETTWLILLVIFAFSILYSLSFIRSFTETLRYLAYFFIFISFRNSDDKKRLISDFLVPFVIVNSFILSVVALLTFIPLIKIPMPLNTLNLYYPSFGHNRLSDMLIFAVPMTVGLYAFASHKNFKIIYFLLLIFFTVILFLTFSRGAVLALILSSCLVLLKIGNKLVNAGKLSGKINIIFKSAVIFGVIAIFYLVVNFINSNFLMNPPQYKGFSKPAMFELRLEYWRQAVESIKKYPFFGTGLDTFRYVSKKTQLRPSAWSFYTHNQYLEIFSETGFMGGLIFSLLIILLVLNAYANLHIDIDSDKKILNLSIFIALTASALHSIIDYDWQFLSVFMLFFICCNLLISKPLNPLLNLTKRYKTLLIMIFLAMGIVRIGLLSDSDRMIAKAENLSDNGNYDLALTVLNKAYLFDPNNNEIHKEYVWIYEQKNDPEKRHYWIQKAIEADSQDSDSLKIKDLIIH